MPPARIITRDFIAKLYRTAGHPIAFSSPGAIYNYFDGGVPLPMIKEALEHVHSYTLHKEYKKTSVNNPYYVYRRRKRFQADLIDIAKLKSANSGVTFLLVVIDTFSRKVWLMPLPRKTAQETENGLRSWLNSMSEDDEHSQPESLLTDSGKEFVNRLVKSLMNENNIELIQSRNVHKAAIVERVNKTIQILIYKYLTDRGEVRYLDVLPALITTYNNRQHRSLQQMTPNEADDPKNEVIVRSIQLKRYSEINKKGRKKSAKSRSKFEIGDSVRIKTYATGVSSARRAYLPQFQGEYFEVTKVNRRMPVTMYELKSMDTEEEIEGGFYASELVAVRGNVFKIERIIRTRGKGKNKKHLIRWQHFGPRWDSWEKASNIVDQTASS